MYRIFEYILLFIVVVVLQVLFFDNLYFSMYITPFVYTAFIILLPMEIKGYLLLLLALALGVIIDLFMGTPAINTIATVFMAFCRPTITRFFIGKDMIEEGGIPNINTVGTGKFIRYALVLLLLHSTVFFCLETLTSAGIIFTLIRIALSTLCSAVVVYFCQLLFISNKFQSR